MFIIKNAARNIVRSPGRNILVGIIIVTIIGSSAIALSISNAANAAKEAGLANLKITATVQIDRTKLIQDAQVQSGEAGNEGFRQIFTADSESYQLSFDDYLEYAALDSVSDYFYSDTIGLDSASDEFVPVETEQDNSQSFDGPGGGFIRSFSAIGGNSDFSIVGFASDLAVERTTNGTFTMQEGQVFSYDSAVNQAIINNQLAAYNDLSLGDKIGMINPNNADETYSLEIIGIYENVDQETSGFGNNPGTDPANAIYVNYETVKNIQANSAANKIAVQIEVPGMRFGTVSENGEQTETTQSDPQYIEGDSELSGNLSFNYVFDSKENYDQFVSQKDTVTLSDQKDPANYTVTSTDLNAFEASLTPLENLSSFALTMLFIILAVGAVILIAVNLINIRERKYEIGVYTAMGISKPKVVAGFATELVIVALLSVGIGAGVATFSSVPVANAMLSNQISSLENQETSANEQFGRGQITRPNGLETGGDTAGVPAQGGGPISFGPAGGILDLQNQNVSYIDQVNATMNFTILGELIGIAILLSLLSSIGGTLSVVRYEPLQILADRS
jgi:putative ABC transport system permease protein